MLTHFEVSAGDVGCPDSSPTQPAQPVQLSLSQTGPNSAHSSPPRVTKTCICLWSHPAVTGPLTSAACRCCRVISLPEHNLVEGMCVR
jgi:hypothetical protein